MPYMKPPHYNGVQYNGRNVQVGEHIEVLPQDVEALAAEGWTISGMTDGEAAAELIKHQPGDDTATRKRRG